jgi:3-dehydroquinate dehydratase-2
MAKTILLINGPNLNLLGTREPTIYGSATLADVLLRAQETADSYNVGIQFFQSNHEGAIVDRIHESRNKIDAIIINPAAFTHTSVALRDALNAVAIPFIEVHITNVFKREQFRHHSYLSDKAIAVISGLGIYGYDCAIGFCALHLKL